MTDQPLLSVIIPVYKAERSLHRCVDSLLCQLYTNLEIWLVDDGSPDGSPAICDDYAARDRRVHVIHQPNQGAFAARNALIARGEIVCLPHDTPERTTGAQSPLGQKANSRNGAIGQRGNGKSDAVSRQLECQSMLVYIGNCLINAYPFDSVSSAHPPPMQDK